MMVSCLPSVRCQPAVVFFHSTFFFWETGDVVSAEDVFGTNSEGL